jgi:hypothetical protein
MINATLLMFLKYSEKDQHEHRIVVENIIRNLATHCVELKVSEFPDILETSTMFWNSDDKCNIVDVSKISGNSETLSSTQ